MREENKALKAQISQPLPAPQVQMEQVDIANDPGVQVLQDLITKSLRNELEPLREKDVVRDFSERPGVQQFPTQISARERELAQSNPNLSLGDRLEQARKDVIAENYDKIIMAAAMAGREEGFKNRAFKGAQAGLGSTPNRGRSSDDFADRYRRGETSLEEDRDRQADISRIEAEDRANIN